MQVGAVPPAIGYGAAMTAKPTSLALVLLALGGTALWLRWSAREPALQDRTRRRLG